MVNNQWMMVIFMQSLPSVKQETQSLHLRKVEGDFWVAKASSVEPLLTDTLQQMSPSFWNIAQTATEVSVLSVVAKHDSFTSVEGPWSVFGIVGQLDFSLTGILGKCSTLLAEARGQRDRYVHTRYRLLPCSKRSGRRRRQGLDLRRASF